jgi:type IV secretion system protein VirB11
MSKQDGPHNGSVPHNGSIKERAKKKLERDLGPAILAAINDPLTIEVMLNEDGCVWQEKQGERMENIGTLRRAQAQAVIETIAGFHGKEVTRDKPLLEGEFPLDGSRFAGQLPPVVQAPTFAIRKKAIKIFTLEQYVDQGILTKKHQKVLIDAVAAHENILVVGGTGSGKTTLINAIINQMVINDRRERVVIIEDTGEIQCAAENYVQYHTSIDVSITSLLKTTLRMRPDRIFVGEVRGPEALDLLDAWNTGHEGGAATLHANTAELGLKRLNSLITRHESKPDNIDELIAEVVHVVVHIARTPKGREVREVIRIKGYENGQYITQQL